MRFAFQFGRSSQRKFRGLDFYLPPGRKHAMRHFAKVCVNWATLRARTSSSSGEFAEGKIDQVPRNAAGLVRLKVDLIVTTGPRDTRAAKAATSTIPIVMAQDSDPVGNGFVASLARPGANITGLSKLSSEMSGKQLELLKEIIPKLSRVAVFENLSEPGNRQALREIELAARELRVRLQHMDIRSPDDIEPAFRTAGKEHADALFVLAGAISTFHRTQIADLAAKDRLPAMYPRGEFTEDGGLMSYGVSSTDLGADLAEKGQLPAKYKRENLRKKGGLKTRRKHCRLVARAATYVDKILKGEARRSPGRAADEV